MAGGLIDIAGNAGERAGGVVVGEHFGMRGGRLIIGGNAGAVLGERMRRGLVVVGGSAADYAGARMIAGTIVINGKVGRYAGFNLRRGSLVLSKEPKDLLPTFGDSGVLDFEYLRLLERQLREDGVGIEASCSRPPADGRHGCARQGRDADPGLKHLVRSIQQRRHARPCAGHPRIRRQVRDVDGRDKPGHDEFVLSPGAIACHMRYGCSVPIAPTVLR